MGHGGGAHFSARCAGAGVWWRRKSGGGETSVGFVIAGGCALAGDMAGFMKTIAEFPFLPRFGFVGLGIFESLDTV